MFFLKGNLLCATEQLIFSKQEKRFSWNIHVYPLLLFGTQLVLETWSFDPGNWWIREVKRELVDLILREFGLSNLWINSICLLSSIIPAFLKPPKNSYSYYNSKPFKKMSEPVGTKVLGGSVEVTNSIRSKTTGVDKYHTHLHKLIEEEFNII